MKEKNVPENNKWEKGVKEISESGKGRRRREKTMHKRAQKKRNNKRWVGDNYPETDVQQV